MIHRSELTPVGTILKPHGIKGELSIASEIDAEELLDLSCIILEMEGIYVPFFITCSRPKGNGSALVTIDGVTDERQASRFAGKTVYARADEILPGEEDPGEGIYVTEMQGYTIFDSDGSPVGEITAVDTSTPNALFMVRTPEGRSILVPAAEELMVSLDTDSRNLIMDLPEGLINQQLEK